MKDLKRIFQLIAFLLLMQVVHTETAFGQLPLDSCICYTDEMDIKAITCIRAQTLKDSLIVGLNNLLDISEERIAGKDTILNDNLITIANLEDENQKINLHLSKAKRNKNIFGLGGLGIGIVGTVLLLK